MHTNKYSRNMANKYSRTTQILDFHSLNMSSEKYSKSGKALNFWKKIRPTLESPGETLLTPRRTQAYGTPALSMLHGEVTEFIGRL